MYDLKMYGMSSPDLFKEYLHSLNIIHNDIKPGNLLVTCDDTLKICDFSISAQLNIFYENEYLKEADKR